MSPLPEQPFTAWVGIDWADTKHDICVQAAGESRRESGCIAHQVAAIDEWANALHRRFGGPLAVALELAKGPIVAALQKYDFLVLFPSTRRPWPSIARRSSPVRQERSGRCGTRA